MRVRAGWTYGEYGCGIHTPAAFATTSLCPWLYAAPLAKPRCPDHDKLSLLSFPMYFKTTGLHIGSNGSRFETLSWPSVEWLYCRGLYKTPLLNSFPFLRVSPQLFDFDRMASQIGDTEKPSASPTKVSADHVELNSLKALSVDILHNDEALRVFAQDHGDDAWSPQEEKRLLRKLDWRLLPLLCFT